MYDIPSHFAGHRVRRAIRIRADNGAECCAGGDNELRRWKWNMTALGRIVIPSPQGRSTPLAFLEHAHRADEEYCLMIHAERCCPTKSFLAKVQGWQDSWSMYRPS